MDVVVDTKLGLVVVVENGGWVVVVVNRAVVVVDDSGSVVVVVVGATQTSRPSLRQRRRICRLQALRRWPLVTTQSETANPHNRRH